MANLVPQFMQTLNTQAQTAKVLAEEKNVQAQTQLTTEKSWLTTKQAQQVSNAIHMQVPKVMEANFQAALYEFIQEKTGAVPTNLTPSTMYQFMKSNMESFINFYKKRRITSTNFKGK